MRDSRIGVFGAAGLILLCLLAVAALAALATSLRLRILVLAPVIGRVAPLLAGAWLAPATPGQGLGAAFAAGLSRWAGPAHAVMAGALAAWLMGIAGVAIAAAAWGLALLAALRGAPPRRGAATCWAPSWRWPSGRPARRGGGRAPGVALSATTVCLVRHGSVVGAETRRFIGHLDVALSPLGVAQVDALSRRLKAVAFDAIYCSDLERTRHSAEFLAAPHALTPFRDPALREFAMGDWDG